MEKTKIETSQVFMYNVNRIWTLLKDQQKIQQLLCEKSLISNSNSQRMKDQNDTIPSLTRNGESTNISLSVKEMITNAFFKQITYELTNLASKRSILLKFILYPNTLDNSTLTILEISSLSEQTDQSEIEINTNNDLYNKHYAINFLELFDAYLKISPVYLYEYQSILINSPLKVVIKHLMSARRLSRVSTCSPYNFIGSSITPNEKFTYYNNLKEKKYGKVKQCEMEKGRNEIFLVFEIYDEDYSQVNMEISLKILMINEHYTFIALHHDFYSSIEQNDLNTLANSKKEFLFDLKKFCEDNSSKDSH